MYIIDGKLKGNQLKLVDKGKLNQVKWIYPLGYET